MELSGRDKAVPNEIKVLLSGERLILRETQRAVTPFGGVAVFITYLRRIGLADKLRQHMPVQWRSPNQIDPTSTFTSFLIAVLVGAKRFAHANLLRGDRALHAMLGLPRFPSDDTIRNLFRRFTMGNVERLFAPLTEWQIERLPVRADGYSLDLDSTIFERATAGRKVRSRATTRASMGGPAITRCWRSCRKPTSSSTAGSAAATAAPAGESLRFSKKPWRYGDSARKSAWSEPIPVSSTTNC